MNTKEIKPCPFCGSDAGVLNMPEYNKLPVFQSVVYCRRCNAKVTGWVRDTEAEAVESAIENWNTRKTAANAEVTERWTNSVLCSNEKHEECAKHKSCFYGGDMEEAVRMFGVCIKYRIITQEVEVEQ